MSAFIADVGLNSGSGNVHTNSDSSELENFLSALFITVSIMFTSTVSGMILSINASYPMRFALWMLQALSSVTPSTDLASARSQENSPVVFLTVSVVASVFVASSAALDCSSLTNVIPAGLHHATCFMTLVSVSCPVPMMIDALMSTSCSDTTFASWNPSVFNSTVSSLSCTYLLASSSFKFYAFGSVASAFHSAFMNTPLRTNSCHNRAAFLGGCT